MAEIDEYVGRRLRQLRRRCGVTQEKLGKQIGVRFQQIQKYEAGANALYARRLWEIARALEVPIGYFCEGYAEPSKYDDSSDEGGIGFADIPANSEK